MRFLLPTACALTFCVVCFGHSDAIIPFGYLLAGFLTDGETPWEMRLLLLVPFVVTLFPAFIPRTVARTVVTMGGLVLLTLLWLLGIIVYVLYPMPGNQIPNWVPAVTSVPFIATMIGAMTYSIRTLWRAHRKPAVL